MAKVADTFHAHDPEDGVGGFRVQTAPQEAVDYVLKADPETLDGRSQWVWIRLSNGDLILGLFPQGDTYLSTEHWRTI